MAEHARRETDAYTRIETLSSGTTYEANLSMLVVVLQSKFPE